MSQEIKSSDGRYLAADQDDGNFVVYKMDNNVGEPVWDRFSYEAQHGKPPIRNNGPTPVAPPIPNRPSPSPPNPSISSAPKQIANNINPIGYSYWRNINYHAGRDELLVALSRGDELTLLAVDKRTLNVIGERYLGIHHTGEGIYFSSFRHDVLYVPLNEKLIAINVFDGSERVVWDSPGYNLWQIHSSLDENVHSATLRDSNYQDIGWGVLDHNEFKRYSIIGNPDECQIDKSGKWLIIKEDDDNRIIRVSSGEEKRITNREGAIGHSDVGSEIVVGEDDQIGAVVLWDLNTLEKRVLFGPNIWNTGYVSIQKDVCLLSLPDGSLMLVKLNGEIRFICSAPTDNQEYENRVKANLCPLAEYAAWTARQDGSLNAYLVRI